MSQRHPIIAVTGSSGAGTSTARRAFEQIFRVLHQKPAYIEGDSFHSYDREQMLAGIQRAKIRGENFSHFGHIGGKMLACLRNPGLVAVPCNVNDRLRGSAPKFFLGNKGDILRTNNIN